MLLLANQLSSLKNRKNGLTKKKTLLGENFLTNTTQTRIYDKVYTQIVERL